MLILIIFLAALVAVAVALLLVLPQQMLAAHQPEYSTAGFFQLPNTGRSAFNMNPAWRFCMGSAQGAEQSDFDDRGWQLVSLPDGLEYLPTEASGCVNYQGEAWYRKHFTPLAEWEGKQLFLHFEAIMGKSKVWVNGTLVKEHFGGYLPVIADVTSLLKFGQDNVIAVWTDNSDDPAYPPGKPQDMLDFAYFGGIYRDRWMVAHNRVFITDPNYEDQTAGGGLFVSYNNVSEDRAEVNLDLHVRNLSDKGFTGEAVFQLYDKAGNVVDTIRSDSRGLAVSRQLPLGRYTIREIKAPANYGVNEIELTAYLEYEGQILRFEVTNKSLTTGVSIHKTGPAEVMAGQPVRYVFSEIGNTSNIRLDSFYWRERALFLDNLRRNTQ